MEISLDLNESKTKINFDGNFFIFPGNEKILEDQLKKAIKDYKSCFLVENNSLLKMQLFSTKKQ